MTCRLGFSDPVRHAGWRMRAQISYNLADLIQGEPMKRIECFLAAALLVASTHASASIPEQVKIETGLIAGTVSASQPAVRAFKGIPFAAPPLGENRWRAPLPVAKWEGVRKADVFGAPCIAGAPAPPRGGGNGGRGA